ncbi:hydrogenase maturation nickel metallochaperone HypA [Gracilibacillus sp. YIM 98692]|uniref:hydrogenase maturation nickel metallochaperone HypA n=1 Tax=Gracilibacillus sp. YIM 98692 TaxID=2663532 RepID=UPI0013D82DCF|nr:hydrogenase maturation nickel metallochaperone HypA [Gracilibacillus sp. YIM 98692]
MRYKMSDLPKCVKCGDPFDPDFEIVCSNCGSHMMNVNFNDPESVEEFAEMNLFNETVDCSDCGTTFRFGIHEWDDEE